jgi:hypothetical protein
MDGPTVLWKQQLDSTMENCRTARARRAAAHGVEEPVVIDSSVRSVAPGDIPVVNHRT